MSKQRLYFLDAVRVFLAMTVFYHHAAIAFGASGGWYYTAHETMQGLVEGLFSFSMTIDQSYFMGLFFFISAFLLPPALGRKGVKGFIKDRFRRLFIPLLLYAFVVHPLICYALWGGCDRPNLGPMWFVFTLIVFELISLCLYKWGGLLNEDGDGSTHIGLTFGNIMLFCVVSGLIAFALRQFFFVGENYFDLQLGYFGLYITMYAAGIMAWRFKWLEQISLRKSLPYLLMVVLMCLPTLAYALLHSSDTSSDFLGGFNARSLFYAMWEPFTCVGISYFLLALAKHYADKPLQTVQWLSRENYAFYFIHPAVLVAMTKLAETLPLSPVCRLAFTCVAGIPACFIAATLLRRILSKVGVRL